MAMRPLGDCPRESWARLAGIFTDIDDTLTTDGRVTADAYTALERLRAAGLLVIPITGRPAGWCDMIARTWPVDAVVGENGAFYFRYDAANKRMLRRYFAPDTSRAESRAKLAVLGASILRAVPGAAISADQPYREADLAIDFREDVSPLPASAIERIAAMLREAGATAKISSIHVNGWFGDYDKLTMTRRLMREVFAFDLDTQQDRFAFVGDSPNDAPMFAFFQLSVGVANVRDFAGLLPDAPNWITAEPRGEGFQELAECILSAR